MNLKRVIEIKNNKQSKINKLINGIKNTGEEQNILNNFLKKIGLKQNEETRFLAYSKIVNFKGESISEYLEKNNFNDKAKASIEDKAYILTKKYHFEIYEDMIRQVEEEKLVSDFYLEILKQTHIVGEYFCDFFLVWNEHLVNKINPDLEKKFNNNAEEIINFLRENKLFDKGHGGDEADRSYSVLIKSEVGYEVKSYIEAFNKEINNINKALKNFIDKISKLEDKEYNRKQEYVDYLNSIIVAFSETNTDLLVDKWAKVDEAWMKIDTPFQIVHPIEYYEDKYRKAVSPEWDIRLDDSVTMESSIISDVKNMYENISKIHGKEKYKSSYDFSLDTLDRTKLHICSTLMSYGSRMTSIYSAQVIPNDAIVTKKAGKKIFAVPGFILESAKNGPLMQISYEIFEKDFLIELKNYIHDGDDNFYKIYDIETIGHELGHTLWLDEDTEVLMNKKTGVFKDIEEFKATSGGLLSFFFNEDKKLIKHILVSHISRCFGLIKYKEVVDVIPYYAESLIHLDILFSSGVISYENKKIIINYDNYNKYKEIYTEVYKDLSETYLKKLDAGAFLFKYVIKEGKSYNAKNPELKNVLDEYYDKYKKIGNNIYLENLSQL